MKWAFTAAVLFNIGRVKDPITWSLLFLLTHLLRAVRRFILSYVGSGKSDTVVAGGCANGVVVFAFE
jgi:hypothetical protein